MTNVAPHPSTILFGFDRDQVVRDVRAEKQANPVDWSVGRRKLMNDLVVMPQHHMQPRIGEGDSRELLGDVSEFGGNRLQKLASDRSVFKEVADFDLSPQRTSTRTRRLDSSQIDDQFHSMFRPLLPSADSQATDFRDRGHGFTAEPHRLHIKQVVGIADFAGGMACYGENQIVGMNPFAIIHNSNQFRSASRDVDFNPRRKSVQTVFEKFLHHARRAFDHFASRNLVDDAG